MPVICGDALMEMRAMKPDSIDAIITDPPAGISFMGKAWDGDKGGRREWIAWLADVMGEALRLLKPGGHALVWALPRTSHWTATALEDAGFEIRDCVYYLFGVGFPKSLDIGKAIDKAAGAEREVVGRKTNIALGKGLGRNFRDDGWIPPQDESDPRLSVTAPATPEAQQWDGWGTALKPSCEVWWLCRKPLAEKNVAANVLRWGTGGINVGACRIPVADGDGWDVPQPQYGTGEIYGFKFGKGRRDARATPHIQGRWPAHLVLDEDAAALLDAQSGVLPVARMGKNHTGKHDNLKYGFKAYERGEGYGDSGGASRFFYCAKASRSERGHGNDHPTVKPLALMRWLCRLITPPGGTVLDPFCGSGSTGVAAAQEGFRFIGIELEAHYAEIAEQRIAAVDPLLEVA